MRTELNKVLNNATWIIVGKILQAVISFVLSIFTTRYLGPESYGIINYAISIVAFAVPFAELGFSFILVKELSQTDREGEVLGTSVVLSLVSSFFCFGFVNLFFYLSVKEETITYIVCCIYSVRLLLVGFELINYWYQSRLLSKYWSIIGLVSSLLVAIYKLFILTNSKSIYWFTCVNLFDYLLIVVLSFAMYKRLKGGRFAFSGEIAKKLLFQSPYYIVASLTVSVFSNTDKIMIRNMLGEYDVGLYSLAFSFVGYTSFIFAAIIDSFRPGIMLAKSRDSKLFDNRMSCLYSINIYLAFIQAVCMVVFGRLVLEKLYGSAFVESSDILSIIAWYTIFSYIGAVNAVWIVANNKQKYLLFQNVLGATLNIILNYFFISLYGVIGAAYATLLTQFISNVVVFAFIPSLKPCFALILRGLDFRIIGHIKEIY